MTTRKVFLVAVCTAGLVLSGCDHSKQEELNSKVTALESEQSGLRKDIADRDKYVEDVFKTINDVYADIEQARIREGKLVEQSKELEGRVQFSNAEARQKMIDRIASIGDLLKQNRKRITDLQNKTRKFAKDIEGLNTLVTNLQKTITEREESIALLQTQVQGLETTISQKTREINDKAETIDRQQRDMNTAYVLMGTRDELVKKGVIKDQGGWLFGWGSTTVLASGIDRSLFKPIDKTSEHAIDIAGKVDEIVPSRDQQFYALAQPEDGKASLQITTPDKFWQDRYLVIVLD